MQRAKAHPPSSATRRVAAGTHKAAPGKDAVTALEQRYLALVALATSLTTASDWDQAAVALGANLGGLDAPRPIRLWGRTAEGFEDLARHPETHRFAPISQRALRDSSRTTEVQREDGSDGVRLLVGLHAGGMSLGVVEVCDADCDQQLISDAAPIVASALALLAAEGVDPSLAPHPLEPAGDTSAVMAAFAAEAKRTLQHDRLSAYLLTDDGRAFERFAVATSPIISGEGVIIPFQDLGLRHVVVTNRPLLSEDLAGDPRIVGREDRIIARAGFHGLVSVPLRMRGRPIGVLNFVSRTHGFYREEDVPVAQQLADQVGVFVESLWRQSRLQGAIRQQASEHERERVSREIYHAVAQAVPEIVGPARELRERIGTSDPWVSERLDRILEAASGELTEVRRAVVDASPRALDGASLATVMESTLARLARSAGLSHDWKLRGDTSGLQRGPARAVYRVFQEALLNIRQHASATRVDVELDAGNELVLVVRDDGTGFDPAVEDGASGLGLHGMRERTRALGGTLTVDTAPGKGTTVTMRVPEASTRPGAGLAEPAAPEPTSGVIRALVVHDTPLVGAGLEAVLHSTGTIRCLACVRTLAAAEAQLERLRPDVVLVAARVLGADPEAALVRIRSRSPSSRLLLLAGARDAWPHHLTAAAVDGCVTETMGVDELADAVRTVAEGAQVFARCAEAQTADGADVVLTHRELEVLTLMTAGLTNVEIGQTLFLAPKTIERQAATIAGKLGAKNRAHAAAIAVARGLVSM